MPIYRTPAFTESSGSVRPGHLVGGVVVSFPSVCRMVATDYDEAAGEFSIDIPAACQACRETGTVRGAPCAVCDGDPANYFTIPDGWTAQ